MRPRLGEPEHPIGEKRFGVSALAGGTSALPSARQSSDDPPAKAGAPNRLSLFLASLLAVILPSALRAAPAPNPPNILLIVADDMGFSDAGCYGGEIQTPNLDKLASGGLRFTQFYNTARCWPSRACILTGYYAQQVRRDSLPGLDGGASGTRPAWARLLPEFLHPLGYRSYHSGKWHIDGKVLAGGFDHSYSLNDHDRNFNPKLHTLDDKPLPAVKPGTGYYTTWAIAQHAIDMLAGHQRTHAQQPFFLYLAFTVPHFPLHALPQDLAIYRDCYRGGWDVLRQQRYARQMEMGLVNCPLSKLDPQFVPSWNLTETKLREQIGPGEAGRAISWDSLSAEQQEFQPVKMALHAAMVHRMDIEIGRVLDQVKAMGAFDNTVVFFLSDNGASAEQIIRGDRHDSTAPPGSAKTFLSLGPGWSSAANTPFRLHKSWVHEGGITTPLIVQWPQGIKARGEFRHDPAHVIDLAPTILELAGGHWPQTFSGRPVPVPPGLSLVPEFANDASVKHDYLWWYHIGNRAIRVGDWKLVAADKSPWELYNLRSDRSETHDLAADHPEKVRELEQLWTRRADEFRALANRDLPRKVRSEKSTQTPGAVQVVSNRKSEWRIVSPSLDKLGIPWAVEELRRYLEIITGAKLLEVNKGNGGPAIVIGLRREMSQEEQVALPPPARGYDGYAICISSGASPRILIAGDNARGAIYGVYDLLERLGCRWFYPTQDPKDPEVVPRANSISLKAESWAVASPMKYRIYNGDAWYFDMQHRNAIKQVDHALKLRCNLIGWQCAVDKPLAAQYRSLGEQKVLEAVQKRALALHGPAHSFNLFLPNELFPEHPDWFGMRDGKRVPQNFQGAQFCWSNPEARRAFAANVTQFAELAPLIHVLAIVPFDGGRACDCPRCRQEGASNSLLQLMNVVIGRAHSVRPELLIETVGGYGPVSEPPRHIQVNPQQRVAWAHWGRYMAYGYDDPRYEHKKNLESWQAAAPGGVTVVQYYSDNFAEPWVMPPFATAIQGDRQYLLRRGIDSIYFLIYPPGYWWNHSLNTYLSARCFYDASLDPFDLIKDYALHYYGPTAGPFLGEYYQERAHNCDLAYHVRGGTTRQDRETLARQGRQLINPALEASQAQSLYAYRVSKVAGLHTLAERLAEGHRLRHQIQFARHLADFFRAANLLETARPATDAIMACFAELANRDEGLIDKNEVAGFIKLGVRGWLDTEAKAIAAKDTKINEAEVLPDIDEP